MPTPNRRLRQARELRGWSQAKVAEQIGTDATTVSRWERGLFSPTPYFREKLCQLFGKNAEELGLLDSSKEQPERSAAATMAPAVVRAEVGENGHAFPWGVMPPQAPSWQQRTDTFAYILQSAVHDVQAHLLWEDAYVRVLQGQRAQAQRSGEASLSAFEQVGHINAAVLREWLQQHGLLTSSSSSSPSTEVVEPSGSQQHQQPSSPVSAPSSASGTTERPVGAIRRFGYGRSLGFLLVLMIVAAVVLCGLSIGQLQPTVLSSPRLAGSGQDARVIATASISPTRTTLPATPTATAARSATTPPGQPTPSPAPPSQATSTVSAAAAASASASLLITINPTKLTPHDCVLEALGYRCTLTLWPFTGQASKLSWQASSRDLPVRFNPPGGTCTPGQPFEVIAYIVSSSGQQGHLLFAFTMPSSGATYTQVVLWQD